MTGGVELWGLGFTKLTALRRLTFRMTLSQLHTYLPDRFLQVLSTITSPVFREFVLELRTRPFYFDWLPSEERGRWEEVEKFFEEQLAVHEDFRFIIRTPGPPSWEVLRWEALQGYAKVVFPLLASRGCIHFEVSLL